MAIPSETTENGKILLVDDAPDVHAIVGRYLAANGYAVAAALGWRQAVEQLVTFDPDLVILDIMMPEVDGLQLCKTLKELNSEVPVILHSSCSEEEAVLDGVVNHMDAYVNKQDGLKTLLAAVQQLLPARQ